MAGGPSTCTEVVAGCSADVLRTDVGFSSAAVFMAIAGRTDNRVRSGLLTPYGGHEAYCGS